LEELLEGFGLPGVAVREEDEGGARLGRVGVVGVGKGKRRMNQKRWSRQIKKVKNVST